MPYNLVEAGAATGKSRSTILRAIRRGVLSASRDDVSGGWAVDPAELHRVYPPVAPSGHDRGNDRVNDQARNHDDYDDRRDGELRELRARLADAHDQVADLRRRLDASDEERRKLTLMLADQRQPAPVPPRRTWWPWRR